MTSLLTEKMVTVFVGNNKFYLHKDLLCDRSDYFRACFDGKFHEAGKKEVRLLGDDAETFELFVDWLYGAPVKEIEPDGLFSYLALVMLCEKLCLEPLHNAAMDQIRTFYRHSSQPDRVPAWTIQYIYENTAPNCPLRRFITRFAAWTT